MGVYRAEAGPSGRPDASAAKRLKAATAAVRCRDCGRPSAFVTGRFSGGTARRTCLCSHCHDLAAERRARMLMRRASLGR